MKTIRINGEDVDLTNCPNVARMLSTKPTPPPVPVKIPYVPHPLEGGHFNFDCMSFTDFLNLGGNEWMTELENE